LLRIRGICVVTNLFILLITLIVDVKAAFDRFQEKWPGKVPQEIARLLSDQSTCNTLILYGPPGTGKTELAQLLAHSLERRFLSICASTAITSWQGSGSTAIKELFASAYDSVSCDGKSVVIFIDELDAFCLERNKNSSIEHANTLITLLAELDKIKGDSRIYCIGATNKYEQLDEALLSRIAVKMSLALPSVEKRKQLFARLLYLQPLITVEQWELLAKQTDLFSLRDIALLVERCANDDVLFDYATVQKTISCIKKEKKLSDKRRESLSSWLGANSIALTGIGLSLFSLWLSHRYRMHDKLQHREEVKTERNWTNGRFFISAAVGPVLSYFSSKS
jgi:SpoVK/Ycf46/Vps4 family AAA+-type ATPase